MKNIYKFFLILSAFFIMQMVTIFLFMRENALRDIHKALDTFAAPVLS